MYSADVEGLLARGRIPAEPIWQVVNKFCARHDLNRDHDEVGELRLVCERQGLDFDVILRTRYRHQNEAETASFDFDVADKLLAGCFQWNLWYEDFAEWYQAVDLRWKMCEREGCTVTFHLKALHMQEGPKAKRFCSRACRQMQGLKDSGKIKNAKKHNPKTHCRNGHKRTTENTNKRGGCRVCERIQNKMTRANHSPERKEEVRQYQAEWYQVRRTTHCRKGHERTPENTIYLQNGKIRCRTCNNLGEVRRYYLKKEAAKQVAA
jgi:hypothetical protein